MKMLPPLPTRGSPSFRRARAVQVALTARMRANEYEADRYAVDTHRQPEALIAALKSLSKDNLTNLTPHPLLVFLTYSHPPLLQRDQNAQLVTLTQRALH